MVQRETMTGGRARRLEGRRVIVTGAGRGIGRAIALACGREGAVVGVNYRAAQAPADELAGQIEREGGPHPSLLRFDVADGAAATAAIERFREERGRIDGIVLNAGINLPGLLVTLAPEKIRMTIDTNVTGTIQCAAAVLPAMMSQKGGVIVTVGSVASERPGPGQAVYAATKGAIEAFTRAIAVEYGRKGIRAVCVAPGPIETEMMEETKRLAGDAILARLPLRRFGQPDDVAGVVVFLLSDDARFVTGTTVAVDGGYVRG